MLGLLFMRLRLRLLDALPHLPWKDRVLWSQGKNDLPGDGPAHSPLRSPGHLADRQPTN